MTRVCTIALALVALALALLAPGTAHAGWRIDRARTIANTVWHSPCNGTWSIQSASAPVDLQDAAAWSAVADCQITVTRDDPIYQQWLPFCDAVLHEVGHLAGAQHSTNPDSVMFPTSLGMIFEFGPGQYAFPGADKRCAKRGRPYLERHDLLRPLHRLHVHLKPAQP